MDIFCVIFCLEAFDSKNTVLEESLGEFDDHPNGYRISVQYCDR